MLQPMNSTHTPIQEKVILVTGASSGIGEATARVLAAAGARVVLGARRTERLERIVTELRAQGAQADFRALDVTQRADVEAFVGFAKERFGRVDALVNNAGLMPLSPLDALKVDEWDRMIDVNVRGVLHGIAAALPIMKAQGFGQILNVASTAAHAVIPTAAVYCATKYAVRAISEGLRLEQTAIRVTVITPGVTESELAHTISDGETRKAIEQFRETAVPADAIARAVLYAIDQPDEVDVAEVIVRPTRSTAAC